jgi:mono/diheme cytochrome c family protein
MFLMKKQILLLCLALAACGSPQTTETTTQSRQAPVAEPAQTASPASPQLPGELLAEGKKVYEAHCLVCHQADGNGVPGLNPPLAGSEWVMGDKAKLIATVLNGLRGPIMVKGQRYTGVMPQQGHLPDTNIAAALTYVRNSFGNRGDIVTAEEVSAARK